MQQWASDWYFMNVALLEAQRAQSIGEVPIGAVIVHDGIIIGRGHNVREQSQLATKHAEMIAIERACETIGSWRLEETTLYVTLEPCMMCSGAIMQSRIPRVVYGAADLKGGTVRSLYRLLEDERLNHFVRVEAGLMKETCSSQLTHFFRTIRARKKREKQQRRQHIDSTSS